MMTRMEKRESIRGVHGRGGSHYCCLERDSPASWHLPFLDHAHHEDPYIIGKFSTIMSLLFAFLCFSTQIEEPWYINLLPFGGVCGAFNAELTKP